MRRELRKLRHSGRHSHPRFSALFQRFGHAKGRPEKGHCFALLVDVKNAAGRVLMDHAWISLTDSVRAMDLQVGDEVFFTARVRKYRRVNGTDDYKLAEISNVCCFAHMRALPQPAVEEVRR